MKLASAIKKAQLVFNDLKLSHVQVVEIYRKTAIDTRYREWRSLHRGQKCLRDSSGEGDRIELGDFDAAFKIYF